MSRAKRTGGPTETSTTSTSRTIKVDYLARVEGEGALKVVVRHGRVAQVELNIFEPPRFFEALLRGRRGDEAPDITARICGICPVAYQMSACHAVERAYGMTLGPTVRALRRLLYCGEWIESHALHIYLLHAPDFLGCTGAVELARKERAVVERGLQLKKVGNEVVAAVGGRAVHPVNVRVGGFYRWPTRAEIAALREPLERARDAALDTVRWTATLDIPDDHIDAELVALRHASEYPFNEGRVVSSLGLDIDAAEFEQHFREEQSPHSNALHCRRVSADRTASDDDVYLVGPLARYSLNFDRLGALAQQAAREAGLGPACRNPFASIIVRSVEVLQACDEALDLVARYEPDAEPAFIQAEPEAMNGAGFACTEAPRGILYHGYRLEQGVIREARIIPPTSQNQRSIERDLARQVQGNLNFSHEALTWRCEQTVRNYDPCISCATHFLKLDLKNEP